MQKAVAQQAKMEANWLAAVQSGKWAQNTGRVTLQEWKTAMTQVGIPRIRAGAEKAMPKLQAYYTKVFPLMQALEDEIAAMPNRDINDSIQRSTRWMLGMNEISKNL
jgi:hypothetical protein